MIVHPLSGLQPLQITFLIRVKVLSIVDAILIQALKGAAIL
jgi:hypothetical protein